MSSFYRVLLVLVLLGTLRAQAQSLPGSDADNSPPPPSSTNSGGDLEELYDKDEQKPPSKREAAQPKSDATKANATDVQNLSDLAKLAPFTDVAVIQRRFLPKTGRFEASLGAFTNLNNPFYSSYGLGLNLAYYIREQWAIEAIGDVLTTASRQVTDNLQQNRSITTTNLVTSNGFYGGALKWNPVYGKMTWLNHEIVSFDLNFSLGGGMTSTVDGQKVGTLHMGSSQVFALSKAWAVRWDFTYNLYQANATNGNNQPVKVTQNDIYLGIGMSFYFPEASYR